MPSKWLVAALGAVIGATMLSPAARAAAQEKKLTLLTWNLPIYEEKFRGWIADFKEMHPGLRGRVARQEGHRVGHLLPDPA